MAALNINRNVDDVFYRYKMPKLVAKVEGKGNGIKTVIANMTDIAKALNRPPSYATKYFGCELGAQTQFDLKNERYIVNGEHDAAKLQDVLDGFIKRYVLCQGCDNPETTLKVKKNGSQIQQSCKACGYVGWIDMKHKLTSFIVKNPPPEDTADSAAGRKAQDKNASGEGDDAVDGAAAVNGENGVAAAQNGSADDEDEEEWVPVQLDEEAKKEAMSGNLAKLIVTDDLELSKDERLDRYYAWLNKFKKEHKATYLQKAKEIFDEAQRLEVKEKAALLLVKVFIGHETPVDDIKKHRPILLRFAYENRRAQKYMLGGIEVLIAGGDDKTRAQLMPQTMAILKTLYDEDIIEEEALLDWGKKATKKYVKREHSQAMLDAAAPFLKWLQEAEEETSEEEEDDTKIEFTYKEKEGMHKEEAKPAAAVKKDASEEDSKSDDEDLDIDNI